MILAVDVDYREAYAVAAAICFETWQDASALVELSEQIHDVAEYMPGQFYKRELPCILAVLAKQKYDLTTIVIDGYVDLGAEKKPGLGIYLWNALNQAVPVIGVAKNRFDGTSIESELLRGDSQKPLFITAVGLELSIAKRQIASMDGEYRIPTLLKRVDYLCRQEN